jgi:hypothetical protein
MILIPITTLPPSSASCGGGHDSVHTQWGWDTDHIHDKEWQGETVTGSSARAKISNMNWLGKDYKIKVNKNLLKILMNK